MTEDGILTFSIDEHPLKALSPIVVILSGIVIIVILGYRFISICPIVVSLDEMIISLSDLQPLNGLRSVLEIFCFTLVSYGLIVILFIDVHNWKQLDPIFLTDDGIVISFNDEHLKNANFPMDVTDDGIVISISDLHS